MNKEKINKLRKIIDDIDLSILRLIIKRSLVVEKIGKIKNSNKDIIDKGRESKVLNKLIKLHSGRFPKDSIIRIWREIFYASAKVQLKTRKTFYPKRELNSIKLYKGGTSKISGRKKIIKLSSNESPFGPSPKALKAYKATTSQLSRYPELTAESLQKKIAEKFNLNPDQIVCGTGSDEVLIFAALAFCSPGDEIIHAKHGFEMYPIITKYAGAESVLASENNYKIDTNSILKNLNESTKVIFIANPNNPTSTYLNKSELKTFIKKIPKNIIVVIDTAYAEFADSKDYDKTFNLADKFDNVLITRTFSKAYSLAGLRLGWGYGSRSLIEVLRKMRPPFNITPGAIAAGIAALQDTAHLNKVVKHNSNVKSWFINEINNLDFKAYPTQSNFVFVIIPKKSGQSASLVYDYLLSKGIAVRHLLSYGLSDAIRITLGTKNELQNLLKNLKEFKKKNV
ncbi:MAG: Histidinol-phosphate aminotransferase [Alphaproteobacteria bacterium MarineAlpha5_Bin11]|nr:histidinol-phosphate transaminase [Pelagibacteraceae bacterium]PPR44998.1 MAG: Histidinol-phosphate aminotransferase [Alphaproteobacteria bacterium MarineAlpha5_Bin11]PPR51404.1 MAG: Histidinol-phosphate aminotransferase [Alphaproteobacteria bacterium MarineAlpha5_Bin10]|tara:strand:+ start:35596 stop:36957 length:1362 start_codon:yes stop_codon:yes gene_type:complete